MKDAKSSLGIMDRLKRELDSEKEGHLQQLRNAGISEHQLEKIFDKLPEMTTAIQRAAFFYEPIDPDIMIMTSREVGLRACIELIELNQEYLSAPFAREHIKNLRIQIYNPNDEIKNQCKDFLKRIADAINQKERDHFPEYFISWHRNNIKKLLQENKEKISNYIKKRKFIKNHFGLELNDTEDETPTSIGDLADYITAKMYGLTPGTVRKYRGNKGFELEKYIKKVLAITGNA